MSTAYIGVAVALSMVTANRDAGAAAAFVGYAGVAFAAPAAVGCHLVRSRGWPVRRAVSCAAGMVVLVHMVLSPVALAAMAM